MLPKLLTTDWKSRLLTQDRLSVLTDIIKTSVLNVPFQNVTSIGAVEVSRRRAINPEELLTSGLTGSGGMCGHINTVLCCLLKSLGYDINIIAGTFRRTGILRSHVLCALTLPGNGVTNDERYIVDAGSSMPLHEPIRISQLPYLGRAGGLNFRFEKMQDGIIQRIHECGDALVGPMPADYLCPQDYTIDPTTVCQFTDFAETTQCFYRSTHLPVHHNLFCFRYLNITDSDFEVMWLRGTDMITATKETRHVTTFKDYYEMHPTILKYFPMIDPSHVDQAVERFQMELQEAKAKAS